MSLFGDVLWGLRMVRARRLRRKYLFSQRVDFDEALRPFVDGGRVCYPDAFYHATKLDFARARKKAT